MPIGFEWPDDPAYAAFVRANGDGLLRLALLVTGNRHDAEDALQEAVIAVARRWGRVRGATALAYMRTAVTRKAIDLHRRQRDIPTAGLRDQPHDDPGLLRYEQDVEFVRMLAALPSRQRAVLVLRYYADLDDAAIAQTLGCSVQTVRSQAFRALAKLRSELAVAEAAAQGGSDDGSH